MIIVISCTLDHKELLLYHIQDVGEEEVEPFVLKLAIRVVD